ncbi:hypothetical protein BE08_44930 [Sorangium cellulosum]|uniref:Uncharacterized protein n=1 Tax=Sorangium cellulosum TaxID=56 RepID=A0A150PBW5_SORCE|nr:hypothetical protein BE08_44930 [Sorangium cellulosum]
MEEVLAAASAEVAMITGAPISLRFQMVDRPTRESSIHEKAMGIPAPREKITALTARLDTGPFAPLAEVTFGELGYPVRLRWENRFDSVSDRASFEEVLKTILEHSATGEKIAALIAGK